MKKAIIIDGNSLLYRAFFALPLLQTAKGEYTNGIYGFTTMLLKVLEDEKPDYIAVALDKGKKTFRHETYKEYKGHRPKMPVELSGQFSLVREMLGHMNIKFFELENYEADDIIGTFSKLNSNEELKTLVVSGDKDVLQLIDDNTNVLLTRKGISQVERYDIEKVFETYEVKPNKLIEIKALMGDKSDNIPGVRGIGEKTAIKLVKEYDSLEGIYENLQAIGGEKLKSNLNEDKDSAFISRELATINTKVPIDIDYNELVVKKFSPELVPFFRRLEFNSLIPKIETEKANTQEIKIDSEEYLDQKLESIISVYISDETLYFSTEHSNFYTKDSEKIKAILEDEKINKICFDYKNSLHLANSMGLKINGMKFDAFLAAYLIQADKSNYSIEGLAQDVLGINFTDNDMVKTQKAWTLYRLYEPMSEQIDKMGANMLLYQVEMPLSEVLFKMETEGVSVDKAYLEELSTDFQKRLEDLEKQIWSHTKEKFNINSPKQLGVVLFEELNLPALKKTKTGYSTDVSVLEQLQGEHPIIDHLLNYRTLAKLKSTYADGLKAIIKEDGKIHTTFNQTITATGRLSSTEPNLQNIPIRLDEGKKIRKCFIAPKGKVLLSLDYSQIELRILAHMSGDENLVDGFLKGQDIHTRTAAEVFGVELSHVTSQQRRHAKAVNFGIVYGMSDFGLSQSLGIPRKEAKEYIEKYFAKYQGVKEFIDKTILLCKEKGYVETMFNRRRYIPEINSSNFNRRSFAERTAVNTPIQGTAADIIKKAMVDFHKKQSNIKLILQVHDELVFLVDEKEINQSIEILKEIMEKTVELNVPLLVDYNYGENWMELK